MLGDTSVEKAFIENFLLTPSDEMWNAFFPEVYPANKRSYKEMTGITTWSFWLMIEMCEYVEEPMIGSLQKSSGKEYLTLLRDQGIFRRMRTLDKHAPCVC